MQFEKSDVKRWRRVVHKELRLMRLAPTEPSYSAAMVLAAIYCFGTDVSVLVEVSGQPEAYVCSTLKRLRSQRALSGQTLRVAWNDDKYGGFAWLLDAMVASGELARPVDPKRSAALKGKAGAKKGGTRRRGTVVGPGAIYTPKVSKSNPLYRLAEWEPETSARAKDE